MLSGCPRAHPSLPRTPWVERVPSPAVYVLVDELQHEFSFRCSAYGKCNSYNLNWYQLEHSTRQCAREIHAVAFTHGVVTNDVWGSGRACRPQLATATATATISVSPSSCTSRTRARTLFCGPHSCTAAHLPSLYLPTTIIF